VLALTVALAVYTCSSDFRRYREFRTGWSWDLAYYNQWYWTIFFGDGTITVRPYSSYATEGPSVLKTNYLAPVRLLILPVYRLAPGPLTLLAVHAVVFWCVVPAAFTLARAEGRSTAVGLAAAALVPLTPLLWPLAVNDFRELQMALPFVLWALQGVRGRQPRLAAFGIIGMLACRQEMAVVVASLAIVPPRESEDLGRSYHWAHVLIVTGLAWFLFAFLGYLRIFFGPTTAWMYLKQFQGDRAELSQVIDTGAEFLAVGLGGWILFLAAAPRVALLMLPWLWSLCGGRWSMRFLAEREWHHVRYAAPFVAIGLAAGLVGFGTVGAKLLARRRGGWWFAAVWVVAAGVSALALDDVVRRTNRQPLDISAAEAPEVWRWIGEVAPDDGVLATYEVTAPLSSRRCLYSYVLHSNEPPGYPDRLSPEIRWVFWRTADGSPQVFEEQGFTAVHRGPFLVILRRSGGAAPAGPE
jgi:hypothetical protein